MPELRLVVLALQERLAYGPTFEAALNALFGNLTSSTAPATGAAESSQPSAPSAAPQKVAARESLINQAAKDLADYQRLTAEGKLGEAGQKLEHLKRALEQLNANQK